MAYLTIQRLDGSEEQQELSRTSQFSIGRQSFNDLCIPEDSVRPLHCRIGWNKTGYEVIAATSEGVEVNSVTVAHADLHAGDVIRIGTYDIIFGSAPHHKEEPSPLQTNLSTSLSESLLSPPSSVDEMSTFEGKVYSESDALMEALLDDPTALDKPSTTSTGKGRPAAPSLRPHSSRPGEQDIFKSPLVIGLSSAGLALLVITGIFWFLISREQSKRLYESATAEMNAGQFTQSVASFEKFIQQYPRHSLRRQAERGLAKVNVMKEISGASPNWARGLDKLNDLIRAHRSEADFAELNSTLFGYADQISLGSARSAESNRDPELLTISRDAQALVERYADPAAPPTATLARIQEQRIKADRAIQKQQAFDKAMSIVDTAISERKPIEALSERERLVRQFPEFIDSRRVKESLQKSIELEKSVTSVDETEIRSATIDESLASATSLLPLIHSRSRTDEISSGRFVFVNGKDSCYAIDVVTGEAAWRKVIGMDSTFFPVAVSGSQPMVLMFDRRTNSLFTCDATTGKFIWQQSLGARVIGQPLIHEGQIYQSVNNHSLVRLDIDSGTISARLQLSQNLATSPVLSHDGNHLLVPGNLAMLYSLALRPNQSIPPLSVVAITFTDHAEGTIAAPPVSMGNLLLTCENNQLDSAQLRVWNATKPAESLIELASARTSGHVRDTPVLRGNQLVVPSSGEQFAAFAVTDDVGRAGISMIGQYRAEQAKQTELLPSPLYLALGSDGQFWSSGSAFRRFEILSDSIRMDSNSTAPGIASQPLQSYGDFFCVGRKPRYCDAVLFSAIDREKLVSPWRCIVGDCPLEVVPTRDEGFFWVGESGTLYTVSKNRLAQGGIDLRAGADLVLPANINRPLRATLLHDQRLILMASGDTRQLILFNSAGQPANNYALTDFPEADPILLDDGIVLPLPGRLKLLPIGSNKKAAQDWTAPLSDVKQQQQWQSVIRVDGRELIACDASGKLRRIQLRQTDVPYLGEVAQFQLEQPLSTEPLLRGDHLYVGDASGAVRQLNIRSFDTDGYREFPGPVRRLWVTDAFTIVNAGDGKLHSIDDGKELPEKWTFDLQGLEPVGLILEVNQELVCATRSGTIIRLNAQTGQEIRRSTVPQNLSIGLRRLKDDLWAIAVDGTIYPVE